MVPQVLVPLHIRWGGHGGWERGAVNVIGTVNSHIAKACVCDVRIDQNMDSNF